MNSQQGYATAIMRLLRSAQICVLSLLALLVIVVTSDTHVIKMAVILPYNNKYLFSMERTMPAIEYAIEAARRYRPNLEFEVHRGDSKCSSVWGALNAFEFYRSNSVHVFLGPVCDYSLGPVARYAPYWQIPVLSAGGMSHDYRIQKQSEYFSLTRTGATFDSLARIVRSLFETQFGWRSLVILSRRPQTTDEQQVVEPINRLCHLATSAINFEYRTNNLKYDYYQVDETKGIEDIELALREKVGKRYSGKSYSVSTEQGSCQLCLAPLSLFIAAVAAVRAEIA